MRPFRHVIRTFVITSCVAAAPAAFASPIYWSGGDPIVADPPPKHGGFNAVEPNFDHRHFEEFAVNEAAGVTVTGLWAHHLLPHGIYRAMTVQWSIRSGLSNASDGLVVASGSATADLSTNGTGFTDVIQLQNGTKTQVWDGYDFLVDLLGVDLTPGTYFIEGNADQVGAQAVAQ